MELIQLMFLNFQIGDDAVTHMYDALPTYPPDDTGVHVLSLTDALIAETQLLLELYVTEFMFILN